MLLDQGRAERALAVLAPLADGGARHLHTMRLLLRAHAALNHHDQMFRWRARWCAAMPCRARRPIS